jgi:hypothetical protein
MRHPNALPQSKEDYLRTLVLSSNCSRQGKPGVEAALLFYHGEVPLHRAKDYMATLARDGRALWTERMQLVAAVMAALPVSTFEGPDFARGHNVASVFAHAGATLEEAVQAAQILSTKLSRKPH